MGAGHNGRGGGFKADGSGRQEPKTGGVDVQSESRMGMGMGMGMRCDAILLRRQVSIRKALRAWQAVAVQGRVCVWSGYGLARAGP
jgi:hypothetical protein